MILIYNGTSIHYEDIRTRAAYLLNTFSEFYSPAYFKRMSIKHQYYLTKPFLHDLNIDLNLCVPTYIFPEVSTTVNEIPYSSSKNAQFHYNGIEVLTEYVFHSQVMEDEVLYSISVDCSYEHDIGDINDVLSKFDNLKKSVWNILHTSITDELREAMAEIK